MIWAIPGRTGHDAPRTRWPRGVVEIVTRDKTIKEDVPLECAMQRTKEIVAELYARINSHVPESI